MARRDYMKERNAGEEAMVKLGMLGPALFQVRYVTHDFLHVVFWDHDSLQSESVNVSHVNSHLHHWDIQPTKIRIRILRLVHSTS